MRCVCGGKKLETLFKARDDYSGADEEFSVVQCAQCRLILTHPVPKNLDDFYVEEYYEKPSGLVAFIQHLRARRFRGVTPGRILDIGCGSGTFLQAMHRLGWECYGTEVSKKSEAYHKKFFPHSIKIFYSPVESLKAEKFDVITLWHVLEHVKNPEPVLGSAARLLKKGGVLIIAVPNIESMQARFDDRWFHLQVPRHLLHFTPATAKHIIEKNGFSVTTTKHMSLEYNIFGFMQTLYNAARAERNMVDKLMKRMRLRGNIFYNALVIIALFPLLLPISMALSAVEAASGRGGTIEIYATKK